MNRNARMNVLGLATAMAAWGGAWAAKQQERAIRATGGTRWRSRTRLAAVVLLACGVGTNAQQTEVSIINVMTGEPANGSAFVELLPADALQSIPTFYGVQARQSGRMATSVTAEAYVYREEFPGGPTFGLFVNFQPTTGAFFPGAMATDDLGLGGGFPVGGTISSYTAMFFRSTLDPNPGELSDFHVELWDGDPF
ncbi:MAG: hypothetical protein ACE5EX_03935 [Phycisphaerae bacterium]